MYKVTLFSGSYDLRTDTHTEAVAEEFVGAIRADVSPSGVIGLQDWTGKQTVVSLDDYRRMVTMPMTDEEILATPDLGEWYQKQIDDAALARKDAPQSEAANI